MNKEWAGDEAFTDLRPDSVAVVLLVDGRERDAATLTQSNGWTYTFTGLPVKNDSGANVVYTVREEPGKKSVTVTNHARQRTDTPGNGKSYEEY